MQNRKNSSVSPFTSTAPPSLTDGQLNVPSSTADYLAGGILWPYSQLFSSPYFPQVPPPTGPAAAAAGAAYPIPIYCPGTVKPHVLDPSTMHFHSHANANPMRSTITSSNEQSSNNSNNNNMTIQIGLQCHNEGSAGEASGGKKAIVPREELSQEEIDEKLFEFTKLAIHGCDIAERVTKNHKYRPCFKKIDSLCARLKQDISRPDGVLNNLNSQGMAWAVKDFIFVFTRIINAWLILKGYVYNQSEGMKKVQGAFSGDFQDSFFQWQTVTQQLIESIVESFENLDEAVQKSRTNGSNTPTGGQGGLTKSRMASIDLNNFLWDNKEVTMRTSSSKGQGHGKGSTAAEEMRERERERMSSTSSSVSGSNNNPLNTPIYNEAERDSFETYYKTGLYQSMKRKGGENGNNIAHEGQDKENESGQMNVPVQIPVRATPPVLVEELDLIDKLNLENNIKRYEEETAGNIQYLLCRVQMIKESTYFFNVHFLKNYFPDFEKVIKDMKDIRTIMMDAEEGKYKYVFALVGDLRMIIESCKLYLSMNPNTRLNEVVCTFESELELILTEKCFGSNVAK